ncbi:MAG TPA: hypothetical protein VF481_16470, partial [Novosphingobium sp.]
MKTILTKALAGSCIAGLVMLAGCNPQPRSDQSYSALSEAQLPPLPASMPLEPGPATPLTYAPDVAALPSAPRPALRRLDNDYDDYAYLDRAAYYDDAFFDAPPDYSFYYDDVSPWGWEGYDGSTVYLEPVDDGYRYYYYEPGYDTPYLVRDRYYSYAYDGPSLVVIYDNYGRPLPRDRYGARWDYAGRYFVRGRELWDAGRKDRRGVIAANWAAQRRQIERSNAVWESGRRNNREWSSYHDRNRDQQSNHWSKERAARTVMARQFDNFQRHGFRQEPSFAQSGRHDRPQFAQASQQRNMDRQAMRGGPQFQQGRQSDPRFQQQADNRRSAFFAARPAEERGPRRQMNGARDRSQQQMLAQREQRGQRDQQMFAQRQQQRADRGQQMVAQREQQRAQRQQQMNGQREQQRAERQQQMSAQREQQRAQRQQQANVQREQQRAQRQQQANVQREQQRAQRQQQANVQREQQRAQRQQ